MATSVTPNPEEVPSESKQKDGLSTVHLYYSDTELYSNTAKTTSVHEVDSGSEEKRIAVVLDEMVMHP